MRTNGRREFFFWKGRDILRKKRFLAGLLAAALSLPLLFLTAGADQKIGDGNIDGGNGGGMGAGSKQNYWNNEDGVRITILKNGQKVYQMDWSNQPEAPSVKHVFHSHSVFH